MTPLVLTERYDDYEPDFTERFPLSFLDAYGVGTRLHQAVDRAATHRQIIALLGTKGIGKTETLKRAREWFEERERRRAELDAGYAPQRMCIRKSSRKDTYEQTLISLSLELDGRRPVKERGRAKAPSQLLEQIAIIMQEQRMAVLALDEGEVLRQETINAFRDVVAFANDIAANPAQRVGLVIVGSRKCEALLRGHDEFGQRIVSVSHVKPVSIELALEVICAWLPQCAALPAGEMQRLRNVVRVDCCGDRPTHMRRLYTVTIEYARRLQRQGRLRGVEGWAQVPIDADHLQKAAQSIPFDFDGSEGQDHA